jgi:hypothetical protein
VGSRQRGLTSRRPPASPRVDLINIHYFVDCSMFMLENNIVSNAIKIVYYFVTFTLVSTSTRKVLPPPSRAAVAMEVERRVRVSQGEEARAPQEAVRVSQGEEARAPQEAVRVSQGEQVATTGVWSFNPSIKNPVELMKIRCKQVIDLRIQLVYCSNHDQALYKNITPPEKRLGIQSRMSFLSKKLQELTYRVSELTHDLYIVPCSKEFFKEWKTDLDKSNAELVWFFNDASSMLKMYQCRRYKFELPAVHSSVHRPRQSWRRR